MSQNNETNFTRDQKESYIYDLKNLTCSLQQHICLYWNDTEKVNVASVQEWHINLWSLPSFFFKLNFMSTELGTHGLTAANMKTTLWFKLIQYESIIWQIYHLNFGSVKKSSHTIKMMVSKCSGLVNRNLQFHI